MWERNTKLDNIHENVINIKLKTQSMNLLKLTFKTFPEKLFVVKVFLGEE